VDEHPNLAALDKLKTRIQALRAKTIDNGCTEDEALSAVAKVAELLDRYDLSLTDVEIREAPCERREYERGCHLAPRNEPLLFVRKLNSHGYLGGLI